MVGITPSRKRPDSGWPALRGRLHQVLGAGQDRRPRGAPPPRPPRSGSRPSARGRPPARPGSSPAPAMPAERVGWVTWAASAARLNEPCSARSFRYWSWRRVGSMAAHIEPALSDSPKTIDWIYGGASPISASAACRRTLSSHPNQEMSHARRRREAAGLQGRGREAQVHAPRGERRERLRDRHQGQLPRQVEGDLLLPEGLHLRLPDRDRRVRPPRQATSRTATPSCSAARPTTSTPSSAGAASTRTWPTCRSGSSATTAASSPARWACSTRRKAWPCAPPSSSTRTTSCSTST